MQIGSENLLKRQGREGLAARALLVACLVTGPVITKGGIVPSSSHSRVPSLHATVVRERLTGGLVLPIKAFLPSPRKAPLKTSGPGSLDENLNPWDFYELLFLLK